MCVCVYVCVCVCVCVYVRCCDVIFKMDVNNNNMCDVFCRFSLYPIPLNRESITLIAALPTLLLSLYVYVYVYACMYVVI